MMYKYENRVEVIDVLRGFALLGILLVHYSGEFAGWSSIYISPVSATSLPTASADSAVAFFLNLVLINKSRALFAFLFGVGFYYQLAKANRAGYRIENKFARRMLILFFIGAMHAYLLWAGDILRMYAVCGLVLLLFYRLPPKKLFISAIICSVIIPAAGVILRHHFAYSSLSDDLKIQMYNGFAGDRYFGLVWANMLRDMAINLDPYTLSSYLFPVFGNFLFGYWAAQTKLFSKLSEDGFLLRRCLFVSLLVGFFCSSSFVRLAVKPFGMEENDIPSVWRDLLAIPASFSTEAMAFFLMCAVVYLYKQPFFQRRLSIFMFAGRMTLTNYIMQSFFAVLFFFGVGLGYISRFGSFASFFIGLLFFLLQLWYSYLWLQYFTMGPVEFLMRSLLERKWQNIRRENVFSKLV